MAATVVLKSGRDRSVRNHHPRLFSGAIKEITGNPASGDIVDICTNQGEWIARGIVHRQAQIAVRVLTWDDSQAIDDSFWHGRVVQAMQRRQHDPLLQQTNARRLIFGESDGLPGLIADDYGGHIVLQLSALAAVNALPVIAETLLQTLNPQGIVVHSDDERLRHECKPIPSFQPYGNPSLAEPVEIQEGQFRFLVNLATGQKTGFYLDQRENRRRIAHYCNGASVLNGFAYTGSFAVYAAAAGASQIINLDSSAEALKLTDRHRMLNQAQWAASLKWQEVCGDAFAELRSQRAAGNQYDLVILDPPKLAQSLSQVNRATRAYKDLNRVALHLVKSGGTLVTFSCSGVVDAALLQKVLFSAAIEADRPVRIVERLTQASDHPVLLSFPESEYLKGLILKVE